MAAKNRDFLITFIILFVFIISFFSDKTGVFRTIFGFLFVLFLPGYAFTSIIFPSKSYDSIERIVLSYGLSVALSPMLGFLVLSSLGHTYILPCLGSFIIFFSLFAYLKRLKNEVVEVSLSSNEITSKKTQTKKLILVSIISSVIAAVIACYFKLFPTIGNALISDILITILVFTLSLLLVYSAFLVKTCKEAYYVLPPYLMFAFIARSIMYLRLPYPPLHDPYVFLIAFINVHKYQTLDPILSWWLPQLEGVFRWPLMLLITENLVLATGLHYIHIFKFQQPLLGVLFFLVIFILTKEVAKNVGVALLAGLFSSLASHVIFFQSEYHAQGLVFVILALLIYSIIKSLGSEHATLYRIITLIFVPALILSHYFSSLFLAAIFLTILFISNTLAILARRVKERHLIRILGDTSHNALFLTTAIFAIFYHIYIYSGHLEEYIKAVFTIPHPYQAEVISRAPFPTNIIKNMRIVLFILAFISVVYIWKTKDRKEFYLASFWLSFIIFSFIGNFFIWLEVGRITAFYETVTGGFGALTIFRFRDRWVKTVSTSKKTIIAVLAASSIITCSFFGGAYVPAYYFKSFGMDEHYWCLNRLPRMDRYPLAGEWIKNYTPMEAKYITDSYGKYGFTGILVFFWGERSLKNVVGTNNAVDYMLKNVVPGEKTYLVLNQGYEYQNFEYLLSFSNLIYANGEIGIYIRC